MSYEEFKNSIMEQVTEVYGKEYKISLNQVIKNNDKIYDSLFIQTEKRCITPNIYLNPLYDYYQNGATIEAIMDYIKEHARESSSDHMIYNQYIESFENLKQNITFRIVNYEKNQKLLENVPYRRYLDLAITYHLIVRNDEKGIGSVRVTKDHLKDWNMELSELERIAYKNTANMFPVVIQNIEDIVCNRFELPFEMHEKDFDLEYGHKVELESEKAVSYVFTNDRGINGAATILYPGVLKTFAKQQKSDFYILPSSIHEVILLPVTEDLEKDALAMMVRDINETHVAAEDVLSNHIYYYSRVSGLCMIEPTNINEK